MQTSSFSSLAFIFVAQNGKERRQKEDIIRTGASCQFIGGKFAGQYVKQVLI